MSLECNAIFKDSDQKRERLDGQIAGLTRLITPNPDMEGKDPLSFRIEREEDTIKDLIEIIKKKEYFDPELSEAENDKKRESLSQEITEHTKEIFNLTQQRNNLIPKRIERLAKLQSSNAVCEITINKEINRETIKTILESVQKKAQDTRSNKGKRLLAEVGDTLETAKTRIDADQLKDDIKIYILDSELKYLKNIGVIDEKIIVINLLENIVSLLENEQLKGTSASYQEKISSALPTLKQCIQDLKTASSIEDALNHSSVKKAINALSSLPTFQDHLTQMIHRFIGFLNKRFNMNIPKPSHSGSTWTQAFELQKQAKRFKRMDTPSAVIEQAEKSRPKRPGGR